MNLQNFRDSLNAVEPPPGVNAALQALWFEAKGEHEKAHQLVQEMKSRDAAWVQAYLHRKAGDAEKARSWYERARQPEPEMPAEEEWAEIVDVLLHN